MAVVGFVLLIACANVANPLLARTAARQKKKRHTHGAGRWCVIRQLLTESVLLAVVGGAMGLLIGYWGVKAQIALNADRIPRANKISLDWRVMLFTFGVAIVTGILFGIVPAIQNAKSDLHETLKEGGRSGSAATKQWVRSALVVVAIAMALAVLVSAGLLVKSFMRVQQVNPGFNPQCLLTMHLSLPAFKYKDGPLRANFYKQVLSDISTLPGVQSVGAVSVLPLSGGGSSGSFQLEGRQVPPNQSSPHGARWAATPEYFKTMAIPIIRGRSNSGHLKRMIAMPTNLRQVISELIIFNDDEVLGVRLNQPQVPKALHKEADPRPRRAHHVRQFFVRDFVFDANVVCVFAITDAAQVFPAQLTGQLQERLAQALFAVHCYQIGDYLLLFSNTHHQVLHKAFK
jgi:hypothetical protein